MDTQAAYLNSSTETNHARMSRIATRAFGFRNRRLLQ